MGSLIYKEESYKIIGRCLEVHNNLGAGFLEIVYKDALEYEFRKMGIPFEREKQYFVNYKGKILTDNEIINIMAKNPKLIERPIVEHNNKAVIGRPPENVLSLFI